MRLAVLVLGVASASAALPPASLDPRGRHGLAPRRLVQRVRDAMLGGIRAAWEQVHCSETGRY